MSFAWEDIFGDFECLTTIPFNSEVSQKLSVMILRHITDIATNSGDSRYDEYKLYDDIVKKKGAAASKAKSTKKNLILCTKSFKFYIMLCFNALATDAQQVLEYDGTNDDNLLDRLLNIKGDNPKLSPMMAQLFDNFYAKDAIKLTEYTDDYFNKKLGEALECENKVILTKLTQIWVAFALTMARIIGNQLWQSRESLTYKYAAAALRICCLMAQTPLDEALFNFLEETVLEHCPAKPKTTKSAKGAKGAKGAKSKKSAKGAKDKKDTKEEKKSTKSKKTAKPEPEEPEEDNEKDGEEEDGEEEDSEAEEAEEEAPEPEPEPKAKPAKEKSKSSKSK